MAARDAERTRMRILQAATAEFAAHGLAGARVDRIARTSGANKQLIYAYFASKQGLFEAVISHHLTAVLDEVPISGDDLPGYAGRLYEHVTAHPQLIRLSQWFSLEAAENQDGARPLAESMQHKLQVIQAAQQAGVVSADIGARQLLVLILAISQAWATGPHVLTPSQEDDTGRRRQAVVTAVGKLVTR